MNVIEMAEHIATQHGMEKKQAKVVIEAVFAAVATAAKDGQEVAIPGFGKFKVTSRDARTGRNRPRARRSRSRRPRSWASRPPSR